MTKTGSNSLKIMDSQRKTLSTKKEHLDEIKKFLNIQVRSRVKLSVEFRENGHKLSLNYFTVAR